MTSTIRSPEVTSPTGEDVLGSLATVAAKLINLAKVFNDGRLEYIKDDENAVKAAKAIYELINAVRELGALTEGAEVAAFKLLSKQEVPGNLKASIKDLIAAGIELRELPHRAANLDIETDNTAHQPTLPDPSTYYDPNGPARSPLS